MGFNAKIMILFGKKMLKITKCLAKKSPVNGNPDYYLIISVMLRCKVLFHQFSSCPNRCVQDRDNIDIKMCRVILWEIIMVMITRVGR